jgi:hypothetical protein
MRLRAADRHMAELVDQSVKNFDLPRDRWNRT